jgi:formate hydrogenlyase subunit 6/NADH:ubiquinone oxidoreductase subunit I
VLRKVAENTFNKPATSHYPFEKAQVQEDFRGQPILNMNQCISCGICHLNCPAKAIEMVPVNGKKGKKYPQFNLGKCVFCYECVDVCPKKAIEKSTRFELATTDKSTLIVKPQVTPSHKKLDEKAQTTTR